MILLPKSKPIRSDAHRRFIASLPCCVTGLEGGSQAAHIRHNNAGMGIKSGDNFCVPLHWMQHHQQHLVSEESYWKKHGGVEKAQKLANDLWANSGDESLASTLLRGFRR